mmetsp:Transcript_9676/g.16729  ORF Transcript_9676/g.16729 Transcript_9676/m.16729 type:complete len:520 (-) Transcript_9676:220-1779(-)
MNKLRKQHDDLKSKHLKQRKTLEELKDEVKDLELEARRPNQDDNPLTRKIRTLENRLDKAMIKYNEAQSIRKTYEQIVKRLKEERVGFDNQLAAIDRTLQAKQRDYEELLLLSGDANHARELAEKELERVRGNYEEERRRRYAELQDRQQVVQLRGQMRDRAAKREKMKQEIIAQEAGDLGEEDEKTLKKALAINTITKSRMELERNEQKSKIDIFESAFRRIKEATGVSDVNEVIQKIVSQESTTENLMLLTKENQAKIEGLNTQKNALKARVEEIKYSGPGGGHRRKMVDDQEEQLNASATRLERTRLKYERLASVLIGVKAGVEHLQDKLEGVRDELGFPPIRLTDESVADVLLSTEQMLDKMLRRAEALNDANALAEQAGPGLAIDGEGDGGLSFALGMAGTGKLGPQLGASRSGLSLGAPVTAAEAAAAEEGLMETRPFNQRIDLPSVGDSLDGDDGYEDGLHDVDEEELTRDKVKKASNQIVMAQDKKKKKPRHKGHEFDDDDTAASDYGRRR